MTNMQLQWSRLVEDQRHSLELERQGRVDLQEKIRHQVAQDTETMRHNGATEAEINRHNLVTEQLMYGEQALKKYQVDLNAAIEQQKILSNREIAEMQNATNTYLGLLKQRAVDVKTVSDVERTSQELDKMWQQLELDRKQADAKVERDEAAAAKDRATAYGSVKGLIANLVGKPLDKALHSKKVQSAAKKGYVENIFDKEVVKRAISGAKKAVDVLHGNWD